MNEKEIRNKLIKEYAELNGRAKRIDSHWHDNEPPADWEELAVHRQNDEVIDFLDERTHERIKVIELALKRMEAGQWFNCTTCGEKIQEERLEALPTTTLCTSCAQAAD